MLADNKATPSTLSELISSIAIRVDTDNKYVRFKELYANDRIAFVYDCVPVLGRTLAPYQEDILGYFDDGHNRVAIRGPHGLGKSTLAALLTHHAILTTQYDAKVPTTASAWRQLEKYLWPEIHKIARLINWATVGRQPYSNNELMVQSIRTDMAEAFAIASDDAATLEGAHATNILFIFDEAKTIPAATFDALEGAFSTEGLSSIHSAKALAISTPGEPSGRFYDIHRQGPGYTDWLVRHVTLQEAIDAGRISAGWAEMRKQQWGEQSVVYQNRVLGEFADNSEDGVIPLSWIMIAVERYKDMYGDGVGVGDMSEYGPKTIGVDVARMGQDSTVIAVRHGLVLSAIYRYSKLSVTETTGHVNLHMRNTSHATIEGDHLGSAVYDLLRENGHRNVSVLVPGGTTYYRDKTGVLEFLNNRSAMWWNMRELLDPQYSHDIMLPDDPRLIGDLVAPKWTTTSRGVIQIESKDLIRKRIGHSPDVGDACCLCFWNYSSNKGGGVVF